ncbi:MAG: plasmid pRiA4b ORF-3 family protein [Gammaproteobacteria bacterium]|nr:plasmid pRiA4b ORF-3 family protein [Gammaproteobacteria bacterium]
MNKKQSNVTHLRETYQIKVLLENIKPPIWRRLQVDSRITLEDLHDAIQASMGWLDMHMHQFIDRDNNIYSWFEEAGMMPDMGEMTIIDETVVLLSEIMKVEKDWLKYQYDFGDGWNHKVILEKVIPFEKNQFPVVCLKGRRACPPEDCGGVWGYKNMLEQLASPEEGEDYAELQEWLGEEFDPEYFNAQEINLLLQELFTGVAFNGKAGLENELKRIESADSFDFLFDDLPINSDLLNDSDTAPEIKQLFNGIQETMEIFGEMDEMLEQAVEAFESIVKISKDKKVTAIAKKMLRILDGD